MKQSCMIWKRTGLFGIVLAAAIAPDRAAAQCLAWSHGLGVKDGVQGYIRSLAVYDDGHGPALYAGGSISAAGDAQTSAIGRWNGDHWSSVGGGLGQPNVASVNALAVFDDGSGSALYVGGFFSSAGNTPVMNIARWNGTSWSELGDGFDQAVQSLCVFDDGTGPALYAGGFFTHSGTTSVSHIARWNGSSWDPIAPGAAGETNGGVYSMAVYDDGDGPALYVGGLFGIAGGVGTNRIARWNGTNFSTLGPVLMNGVTGMHVDALRVFDDGSGSALYAGGSFTSAGGVAASSIAKFDGTGWSALGSGIDGGVKNVVSLTVFDDGAGPALYAGGNFTSAGGTPAKNIAQWNGAGWSALGAGLGDYYTFALAGFDDGSGPALFAGGSFATAGTSSAQRIARWKNGAWSALSADGPGGMNGIVYALETFDDGGGPALYVGGSFTQAGATAASRIARWRNGAWTAVGTGLDLDVYALLVFNDGSGPALYAAGAFTSAGGAPVQHIAKWNGASWVGLGSGLDGSVRALAIFNDGSGPALYAGGDFTAAGAVTARGLARWKSSTWSDVGGGLEAPPGNASVKALAVFDSGTGPVLFAGGSFSLAGGNVASNIAAWNGSAWWIGFAGPDGPVSTFALFDFGAQPALHAGGNFSYVGGQPARGVAAWTGSGWWPLGSGLAGGVTALEVFDDGSGPALYAAGSFVNSPPATTVNRIAQWNGFVWSPLGAGLGGYANALGVFQDASYGSGLYVGGAFYTAGTLASSFIAEWRGCGSGAIDTLCFGDGSVSSCPCGIEGAAGRGCQNSGYTGGARLEATGAAQPDTIVLHASGELPHAVSVFLQGDQIYTPAPFGDGWLCTGGNLTHLFVRQAVNGSITVPQAGDPSISARSAALGDVIAPGSTRYYQTYYRDPSLSFCPAPQGDSWNITNGVKINW
jgi:hypothetical protein